MRYKPGEKVIISKVSLPDCELGWTEDMDVFLGCTMTIENIGFSFSTEKEKYIMVEDSCGWAWDDSMIDHEKTVYLQSLEIKKELEKYGVTINVTKSFGYERRIELFNDVNGSKQCIFEQDGEDILELLNGALAHMKKLEE